MQNYSIPDHIKTYLTPQFLAEYKAQLAVVFPGMDYESLCYVFCSVGAHGALRKACQKFGFAELLRYEDALEWYDWDYFMSDLLDMAFA